MHSPLEKSLDQTQVTPPKQRQKSDFESPPSTLPSTYQKISSKKQFCSDHPGEKAHYICINDNTFLCLQCAISPDHSQHQKIPYKKRLNHFREKLQQLQDSKQKLNQLFEERNNLISHGLRDLLEEIAGVLHDPICRVLGDDGSNFGKWMTTTDGLVSAVEDVEYEPKSVDYGALDQSIDDQIVSFKILSSENLEEVNQKMREFRDEVLKVVKNGVEEFCSKISGTSQINLDQSLTSVTQKVPTEINPTPQQRVILNNGDLAEFVEIADFSTTGINLQFSKNVTALEEFFTILENFESLEFLTLDLTQILTLRDEDLELLSKSLQKLNNITSFSLMLPKLSQIEDFSFDTLSNSLAHLPLNSLTLNPPLGITASALESLFLTIKAQKRLAHLSVDLCETKFIDDYTLTQLADSIINLKNLESLSLNLSNPSLLESESYQKFFGALAELKNLTSLTLILNNSENLNSSNLQTLSNSISGMPLVSLNLSLQASNALNDKSIPTMGLAIQSIKTLKSLSLNFKLSTYLTDLQSNFLLASLASLKNLEKLNLVFARSLWVSQATMKALSESLGSLTELKCLSFDFSGCELLTTTSLHKVLTSMQKLSKLEKLSLTFNRCFSFDDNAMKYFASSLRVMENLQNLTLNMTHAKLLTQSGLLSLSLAIKNMKDLHTLNLNFACSPLLNDKAIESLGNGLKELTKLNTINLNFSHCDVISDWSLQILIGGMKKISELETLGLNFSVCDKIGSDSVNELTTMLKKAKNLEFLDLNFSHCSEVNKNSIENLVLSMKGLENLQKVRVNFVGCISFSVSEMQSLRALLKDQKKLDFDFAMGDPAPPKKFDYILRTSKP